MAKANMVISEDILNAWKATQTEPERGVRALLFSVDSNNADVHLKEAIHIATDDADKSSPTSSTDGDSLQATMEAAFAALELKDESSPILAAIPHNPQNAHLCRWSLLSFIPEGMHPRHKMKYAAARDDLKKALGPSRFTGDYHVTESDGWNAAAFLQWFDRSDRTSAMTESEKVKERVVAEFNQSRAMAASAGGMMPAMAALQFKVAEEVLSAAKALSDNTTTAETDNNIAELALQSDVINMLRSDRVEKADLLATVLERASSDHGVDALSPSRGARDQPRYFLIKRTTAPLALLFYCSEDTAPKLRMGYTSAKACLLEEFAKIPVEVSVFEARDKDELAQALKDVDDGVVPTRMASSPTRRGPFGLPGLATPSGPSSPLPTASPLSSSLDDGLSFSRPARAGRGAPRVPGAVALPGLSP